MKKFRVYFSKSHKTYYYVDVPANDSDEAMKIVDSGRHIIYPVYEDKMSECHTDIEAEEYDELKEDAVIPLAQSSLFHFGLLGSIEWDDINKIYFGKVRDIPDLILYEGNTLAELEKDFKEAVEEYIRRDN